MPVLPLVGSTTVPPAFSSPLASMYSTIATPIRSFTEASGLKNSSLATTSAFGFSAAESRGRRTRGVSPTRSRTESKILPRPARR